MIIIIAIKHFLLCMFEQLLVSLSTGKNYTFNPKNNNNMVVLNHINCNNSNNTVNVRSLL